jgi:type I pantothenate kinase
MEQARAVRDDDPGLVALAAALVADASARPDAAPLVVGLVGSVAVGKSTFAESLAEVLREAPPDRVARRVEVVATDSFLLPNSVLEPMGGAMVKGTPSSYDWVALERFLRAARDGATTLSVPVYSHRTFDIVDGELRVFPTPEVVLVEGLNLLQAPPVAPVDLLELFDRTVYLHAPTEVVEQWFVERFADQVAAAAQDPESFYAMFAAMDPAEVDTVARWTWHEINRPNLERHIAPTRDRAHLVVHLGADHAVQRLEHRRAVGG